MTRNGKIARLPRVIREELNRRLDDGETADTILKWVNAEPKARVVMEKEQFSGAPINKQNLSEWRQGGHEDWLRHRQACEFVSQMREQAEDLNEEAGEESVSDRLAAVLAAELARTAQALMTETTDPAERWQRLQELLSQLGRLRREDHRAMRLKEQKRVQRCKEDRQKAEEREAREKLEEKRTMLAPLQAMLMGKDLPGGFGDADAEERIEKLLGSARHEKSVNDDPVPRAEPRVASNPVKVSQGESSSDAQNRQKEDAKTGDEAASEKSGPIGGFTGG